MKVSPLSFCLVISKNIFNIVSFQIFLGSSIETTCNLSSGHTFFHKSFLQILFKLHNLNIIFISDSCNFFKMAIFQYSMSFSKEIVDNQRSLTLTTSKCLTILFNQWEYLCGHTFIVNIYLVFSLCVAHILGGLIVKTTSCRHLLSLQ